MKKLLLIFFTLALSCSTSDDSSRNNDLSINPPNWIIGTWLLEPITANFGARFTNDDVVLISGTQEISLKVSTSKKRITKRERKKKAEKTHYDNGATGSHEGVTDSHKGATGSHEGATCSHEMCN